MRARVTVLLATYNGSRFLHGQLRSIESQTLPPHRIAIRDDQSTDHTLSLLQQWAIDKPQVEILQGSRLGPTENFLSLLSREDNESEFFAFCDQDDIWLPDKLERAATALQNCGVGEPAMYCSRVEFVGENLEHIGYSRIPRHPNFTNALVENVAVGCTVVLNQSARDLISTCLPTVPIPHDWWCYLVVSAFGSVYYDAQPTIKYRQHTSNVIGGTSAVTELFKRRLRRFSALAAGAKLLSDKVAEFNRCFGKRLSSRNKAIVDRLLGTRGHLWKRLSYNWNMDVWRQTRTDTAILRMLILARRL